MYQMYQMDENARRDKAENKWPIGHAILLSHSPPTHSHSLALDQECARLFSHLLLRPVTVLVTWTGAGYPAGRFHLDNAPFVGMKHGYPRPPLQLESFWQVKFGCRNKRTTEYESLYILPPKLRWLAARESSTYSHSGKGSTEPGPNCSSSSGADPRSTTPHHPCPFVYFKVYEVRTGPLPERGMAIERLGPRVRPSKLKRT